MEYILNQDDLESIRNQSYNDLKQYQWKRQLFYFLNFIEFILIAISFLIYCLQKDHLTNPNGPLMSNMTLSYLFAEWEQNEMSYTPTPSALENN